MKGHLYQLILISFGALQLCSCERADEREQNPPPIPNKLTDEVLETAHQDQSQAVQDHENAYAGVPDNEPLIHHARTGELDPDGWCRAKPTRGNFSVMLPGEYVDSMLKMPTKTGGLGVMHTVQTKTAEGVEFHVLQTEFFGGRPSGSPEESLIERFQRLGATVDQENVVLAELPALRLHVQAEGVAAEFILISSAENDYMLAVQSRPSNLGDAEHEANIERFFSSFQLTGSAD